MESFFKFLGANPFLLLFRTVGLAVWVGRFSVKGYGLGMVAAAIVVGVALATWASTYGVKLQLDNFAKSLMYYLFMYGVGLRVGPSFFNSLKKDGLTFTILAVICSVLGLGLVVVLSRMFELPPGAVGGVLAGSQNLSAAIGTAELAVTQGAFKIPAGSTAEGVSAMIALGYGISYIWGTVGIILICKYLPKWWGVDARKSAKEYEEKFGVPNLDDVGLSGYRPGGLRAYRLENRETAGKSIAQFRQTYPQYRILNIVRGGEALGASPDLAMQLGDVVALGGRLEDLTANMGLLGPEVHDAKALAIPLDQAEILVTDKGVVGKALKEFRHEDFAGQMQVVRMERGGVPFPVGAETKLQRFDVIFVAGLKSAVEKVAAVLGRAARPSTATDLLTLSVGMILGLLIGGINVPVGSFRSAWAMQRTGLLSGIFVSSAVSRLRFFGSTPNAARNILEDLGLVAFVAIVGINAGASLLAQLTGAVALKIFIVGFIACTIPPFVTWALGYHLFKINPAVLMGGVAGARSHSGPCREAAKEIGSSVPWVGFPVGYAVSGVLLTVFGYFAMIL
jgi:putative transport protein